MSYDQHIPVRMLDLMRWRDALMRAHRWEQRRIAAAREQGLMAASRPSYIQEICEMNQALGDESEEKTPLPMTAHDTQPGMPAVRESDE